MCIEFYKVKKTNKDLHFILLFTLQTIKENNGKWELKNQFLKLVNGASTTIADQMNLFPDNGRIDCIAMEAFHLIRQQKSV